MRTYDEVEDLPQGPAVYLDVAGGGPLRRRVHERLSPDGVEGRHAEAWARFAPVVAGWVDVVVGHGAEGLQAAWLETLAGATPPRTGHVIQL